MRGKKLLLLIVCLTLFCVACVIFFVYSPKAHTSNFSILHFNDLHSHLVSIDEATGGDCTEASESCLGGIAHMKSFINAERSKEPTTLVLTSGDNFQGSIFFNEFKEDFVADILTMLDVDVMSVGNHEFDLGDEALARFAQNVPFPVLEGNIRTTSSSPLFEKLAPPFITTIDGATIGILSAVTKETRELSSPSASISFGDEITYLREAAQELKEKDVDFIIALTHVGYDKDKEIAQEVPFLNLIIGGHSNTFLSNSDQTAEGPYPTWIENKATHNKVAIVQTPPFGTYIGKLSVSLDTHGNVIAIQGAPHKIDTSRTADPEVLAFTESKTATLAPLLQEEVGYSEHGIEGKESICRKGECAMGNLKADALVHAVATITPEAIAIINSGSVRASIDAGPITKAELITASPFEDTISTSNQSGAQIRALLERSLAHEHSGAFLQVSGLSVAYDPQAPDGAKICNIIHQATHQKLKDDTLYPVIFPTYLTNGGDGYAPIADARALPFSTFTVLQAYVASDQYKEPTVGDRIIPHCDQ